MRYKTWITLALLLISAVSSAHADVKNVWIGVNGALDPLEPIASTRGSNAWMAF